MLRGALFFGVALVLAVAGGAFGIWQMGDHLVFRALHLTRAPEPGTGIRLID